MTIISFAQLSQNEPILTIFGTQNPEDIWYHHFYTCPPHLKNVTALPCETQNLFTCSKLFDFSPKSENFGKNWLFCCPCRNLHFRKPVSDELLKVTIVCVDTLFLSFCHWYISMLRKHSANVSTKNRCGLRGCYARDAVPLWMTRILDNIILWICRRATVNFFYWQKNKFNLWLWELVHLQLRTPKTFIAKMIFF